jgi:hypothetical protein
MSSNDDYTTPEKKRKASPPAAPDKKRLKKTPTPTEDYLLLVYISDDGQLVSYSSNHAVLSGVSGHHGNIEFLSDELFENVADVVGGNGYSSVSRDMYFPDEIMDFKKKALIKLFSEETFGGGGAQGGEVFRGTIVM